MRKASLEFSKRDTPDGPVWITIRSPNKSLISDSDKTPWKRGDDRSGLAELDAMTGTKNGAFFQLEGRLINGVIQLGGRLINGVIQLGGAIEKKRSTTPRFCSVAEFKRYLQADHYGPLTPETARRTVCKIVSVCAPSSGPSGVREPVFVVVGNRLDVAEVLREPIAREVIEATEDEYRAGVALARAGGRVSGIWVHTGTTTVEPGPFPLFWDVPERKKPPSEPVWAGPAGDQISVRG
jgi:hypothetical protein